MSSIRIPNLKPVVRSSQQTKSHSNCIAFYKLQIPDIRERTYFITAQVSSQTDLLRRYSSMYSYLRNWGKASGQIQALAALFLWKRPGNHWIGEGPSPVLMRRGRQKLCSPTGNRFPTPQAPIQQSHYVAWAIHVSEKRRWHDGNEKYAWYKSQNTKYLNINREPG
jgi:hypothetical protein